MTLPVLTKENLIRIESKKTIDYYYCFCDINQKDNAINLIHDETKEYDDFIILYDFKMATKFSYKEWNYICNTMIYENHKTNDSDRLVTNGTSDYECILWVSINKK